MRLDFLRKVLRKNWPSVFSACKPLPRHPSSTAVGKEARPFEMRHLMVILLPLAKHKTPPPLPSPAPGLLLCHCKHCHGFGGKGKLFCVCVNQHFDRQGKLQSNSKL